MTRLTTTFGCLGVCLALVCSGCGDDKDVVKEMPQPDAGGGEPLPSSCFIIGASFVQCYDNWPLFECVPPNHYVQGKLCADEGLCQDACSGTWLECTRARTTCPPPPPTASSECKKVCDYIFDCRDGDWFMFTERIDPENCPFACDNWDPNRIDCALRQDCITLSGPIPACFYVPNKACDDCLDACRGLPGCCTGAGCICESDC